MAKERSFLSPRVLFGDGAISRLSEELQRLGSRRAMLLTTKMSGSSAPAKAADILTGAGIECKRFSGIEAEPSVATAEAALEAFTAEEADVVVGLGGGSALDVAKAVALSSGNGGIRGIVGINKAAKPGAPNVLIPTTSGTGSEATNVSVLTDQDKRKAVIYSNHLIPTLAIVDPELTYTMPKTVTAHTGMDALTHSIEAYLSVNSSHISDSTSIKAMELISKNLVTAYNEPENGSARHGMSLAALFGGMSIANAGVNADGCYMAGAGIAHAVGLVTGTKYSMPHGLSVGMVLPAEMRFLKAHSADRLSDISRAMGGDGSPDDAVRIVESIMQQTGVHRSIREYGRSAMDEVEEIVMGSLVAKRLLLNMPIEITKEHMHGIVSAIL